jgi:adenosylhomocysteine nucleosidase
MNAGARYAAPTAKYCSTVNGDAMNVKSACFLLLLAALSCAPSRSPSVVVLVSANAEWESLKAVMTPAPRELEKTPYGEFFSRAIADKAGQERQVLFFHGGWGKIDAAGSTQYAIARWDPELLVNIGTAGGFAGRAKKGQILLVTRTVTYDIYERMGDAAQAIDYYSSTPEVPVLLDPEIKKEIMVSGDQDIDPRLIPGLVEKYGASAADWESSSIAHVAKKNGKKLVILRGVSDVVDRKGSETYGNEDAFREACRGIMKALLDKLPLLL